MQIFFFSTFSLLPSVFQAFWSYAKMLNCMKSIFLGAQARPGPTPTFKAWAPPRLDFIGPNPSLTTTRLEFIKVYLLLLISKELGNSFGGLDISIILFVFSMLYKFYWYIYGLIIWLTQLPVYNKRQKLKISLWILNTNSKKYLWPFQFFLEMFIIITDW